MIKERIENLSNIELRQCYLEIKEYNKNGFMGETLVRKIRNEIASEMNDNYWDVGCTSVVIPAILMEIADRAMRKELF